MTEFTSEAALASAVSNWMRADGWRTYHEVPCASGRIDILAVRRGLIWAVETKLRLSIDVINQALDRRDGFQAAVHGSLVAVPKSKSIRGPLRICQRLGVGVIVADKGFDGPMVEIESWPEFHRRANTREMLGRLAPEQEDQTPGRAGGRYWTPFKEAARDLIYALADAPGNRVAVAELAAHAAVERYKGARAAPQLRRWLVDTVERGLLPGVRMEGSGRTRFAVFDRSRIEKSHMRDLHLEAHRLAQRT